MQRLDASQKNRLQKLLTKLFAVLAVGFAYFMLVRITGIGIPCLIRLVTHRYCPGCGISRMCMALLRGDIGAAFRYNMLIMSLLPFALVFCVRRAVIYIKNGESQYNRLESALIIIAFVFCVAFWIMRNTEMFAFMAPLGAL